MYSRTFNNTHVEENSNIGYFIVSKKILYNRSIIVSFHSICFLRSIMLDCYSNIKIFL